MPIRLYLQMLFFMALPGVSGALFAQNTLVPIAGTINRYTRVTGIDSCSGRLLVSDTSGFRVGGGILILQMKGAQVSTANNAGYGTILQDGGAGRFERARIASVEAGALVLQKRLINSYNPAAYVQAITFPEYPKAIVADTLRAKAWDGFTGGLLLLEVADTLYINAPVTAAGCGFRGGQAYVAPVNNCNWLIGEDDYFYPYGNWRGAFKGESMAELPPGQEFGRGAPANGGGGGNDHNAGGGGGALLSGGGRGGDNDEPSTFGCDGYFPGVGGYSLPAFAESRLLLGGGGGGGHTNNGLAAAGGAGGGIVMLKAGVMVVNQGTINADGADGQSPSGDGAGGGGAGGTIWISAGTANPGLLLSADGGKGGNSDCTNQNRCTGPGGGGGGGRILSNLTGISIPAGGQPGIVSGSLADCSGSSNGAQPGADGQSGALLPVPEGVHDNIAPYITASPVGGVFCSGDTAIFICAAQGSNLMYQWQMLSGQAWIDIAPDANLEGIHAPELRWLLNYTTADSFQLRCQVTQYSCVTLVSQAATVLVEPLPLVGFTAQITGGSVVFENQSQFSTDYWWDFGDGFTSAVVNPNHSYSQPGVYVVQLKAWNACDTVSMEQMLVVEIEPIAGFTVSDTIAGCQSALVSFSNTSTLADSYAWSFPGGQPAFSAQESPQITYAQEGWYTAFLTANNASGSSSEQHSFYVVIQQAPLAQFSVEIEPDGWVICTNESLNATSWTWDFGDGTPVSHEFAPQHQFLSNGNYTVTLTATNICGAAIVQQTLEIVIVGAAEIQQCKWALSPNPADTEVFLTIDWQQSVSRLRLIDATGVAVFYKNNPAFPLVINTAELPAGIFLLEIVAPGGRIFGTRLVVQH